MVENRDKNKYERWKVKKKNRRELGIEKRHEEITCKREDRKERGRKVEEIERRKKYGRMSGSTKQENEET